MRKLAGIKDKSVAIGTQKFQVELEKLENKKMSRMIYAELPEVRETRQKLVDKEKEICRCRKLGEK